MGTHPAQVMVEIRKWRTNAMVNKRGGATGNIDKLLIFYINVRQSNRRQVANAIN